MRLPFSLILAILCLNMGFYIASQTCPLPSSAVTLTPEEISGQHGFEGDVKPPSPGPFDWLWYIVWGVPEVINGFVWVFIGFPVFLHSIEAPDVIVGPIFAILGAIWFLFFMQLWTGRQVID